MTVPMLRIMVARHSAFYSPLLSTLGAGFLEQENLKADYAVLPAGARSHELIRSGQIDIMQSAVSSNWGPMRQGQTILPAHFALINRRDGFFLTARQRDDRFEWRKLQGRILLADHGLQPLAMLRYAAWRMQIDWDKINVIDAGSPEAMDAAFRGGRGDYIHQQGPAPQQLENDGVGHVVAAVGDTMPPVAFSTLCASREFLSTDTARSFLRAYRKGRQWANHAPAGEIARAQASFFPGVDLDVLAATIARYQALGCWDGDLAITRQLYDQALEVFLQTAVIGERYRYEEVVCPPPE